MSNSTSERVTLATLARRPLWVAWQTEVRAKGEKPTKVPYNPRTNGKARADRPETWGSLDQAEARAARLPKPFGLGGVGLELGPIGDGRHLSGVDLDTCRNPETGAIEGWARAIIDRVATYAEISPSRTGVKLFCLHADVDRDRLRGALGSTNNGDLKHGGSWTRRTGSDHPPAIEVHFSNRYFAVTGEVLEECTDEIRPVAATELLHLITIDGPTFIKGNQLDNEADPAAKTQEPPSSGRRAKRDIVGQDQSRSVLAFRMGAAARRDGANFDQMCEAIRINPNTSGWYFEKGLSYDGRELHRIWDKTDPFSGDLILSRGAPLTTAKQFISRAHTLDGIGGSLRTIHHQNSSFYTWQGSHYREQPPEETRALVYRFLDSAKTVDATTGELTEFEPNKSRVANVIEALAAEAQLSHQVRPPVWLPGAPVDAPNPSDLVACQTTLLHLPTRQLLPHTPALFCFNALPFDYNPQPPPTTGWTEFLNAVWPDDSQAQNTLQELFGLALTADTSHQKAFLIVGPKRSGKGTIARVLTEMLGAANVCNPTLSSLSSNFGIAPMIGKRLAVISDARLSGKADHAVIAERILAITGEDNLTIDRKFREAWTGKLDARFLVLTNELPRLTDSSGALASRFIILVMTRSFYGQENRGLLDALRPELPGILHWSIEGLERLKARGHFLPPESAAGAMRELQDLGSPIGAFLRDCCEVRQGLAASCTGLYQAWCTWCGEQGRDRPGTVQTFGRDLNAAVPGLKISQPRDSDGSRGRYYDGVGFTVDFLARSGTRSQPS